MAAYGGHNPQLGIMVYLSVRRGTSWPPRVVDVRIRYDETMGELKRRAARALDVPLEMLQLLRHGQELTADVDDKTIQELEIHTGAGLQGWDLREPPSDWPPRRPMAPV